MCASRKGLVKPAGAMRVKGHVGCLRREALFMGAAPLSRPTNHISGAENEHTRWDPKDGELCLNRMKP